MTEEKSEADCPLCASPAQNFYTSRKDRKRYECQACIHPFLIGRKAENILRAEFAASSRSAFCERVRDTPDGYIADIYCPPSIPNDTAEARVVLDFILKNGSVD